MRHLHLPPTLHRVLTVTLSASFAANAVLMLALPRWWYDSVPGVALRGPFNLHFIHDIGVAYLAASVGLAWRAWSPAGAPAALVAALFLGLHAAVHVVDLLAGRCGWESAKVDIVSVLLPAVLAAVVAPGGNAAAARSAPRT
ncbi:hypothetical protein [Caldimonas brevitalea]|uniref:Uncharacterized protein n=1 Tax=Caldimonas brevitalea TaxID=413882 RepID=A0A0G3BCZ5_9BURK|nr:hypothetical protein [Caldimonas brevitalea]AKJ27212.1 hypothetical protein AAW51_0521 [Caldimonas brevitalea]